MLTLRKFELQINDTLVRRGRDYYESAAVVNLEETEKGCWHAEVIGNNTYTVGIALFKKDQIKSYSCSCPYDGDICKHVLAVLFLLRDELMNDSVSPKTLPGDDFDASLQKISLEEYQEFIQAYAAGDKKFKALFESRFADKDKDINPEERYTALLKSIIQHNSNGDFIDYRSVRTLTGEINALMDVGRQFVEKENFRGAFVVARPVLTEVIELLTYCDDSDGYIGDTINSAVKLIMDIAKAESVTLDLQEEIFDFVQAAISRSIYFEYGDFGYEMVNVYQLLALKLGRTEVYLNLINGLITMAAADQYSYRQDYFLVQKISFLKAVGNVTDAQTLVHQHLDIVDVRRGEVNSLIAQKDFSSAKKLIADGIELARKKGHRGTAADWQKELLHIAVLENDASMIRHYTKHFAFDDGFDPVYYNQWKNTFTIAEWEVEIERYIEERIAAVEQQYQLDKGKAWYSPYTLLLDLLAPVYIEEEYWDRLLALMREETDLDRLLQYHDYLVKRYPMQLLAIYLPAFERKGDIVGNRSQYADLAAKMKMVITTIPEGREGIIAVAQAINRKYSRRPAMVKELNTVIGMVS
jgi:hypothetical protein